MSDEVKWGGILGALAIAALLVWVVFDLTMDPIFKAWRRARTR